MHLKQVSNYSVPVPAGYVFRNPVLFDFCRISKTGIQYIPSC